MELKALVEKQIDADQRRGFPLAFASEADRHVQLAQDLVGLLGEIGEFANLVKKARLRLDHPKYDGPTLDEASGRLREELSDALIYIIRLSVIVGGDLERDVLSTMAHNDNRYRSLESE
jgi:NTP pyrophosphatase (non-canonical NTP hydrolase)